MPIETWVRKQTINSDGSVVIRLTDAKSRVPSEAYITGDAPDVLAPPAGKRPIQITWPTGKKTLHFVRQDHNPHMITDRTEASETQLKPFMKSSGQKIAITAIEDGEFLISLLPE